MNKYTELSDFEINKKVADLILNGEYVVSEEKREVYLAIMDGGEFRPIAYFDTCNNPANAMPIIIENLISLMADMSEDGGSIWWCASDISNGITSRYKSNPLRAAMEVFLMLKEAENEKV
ncbi:phage protein NinX family protein [Proteus mirabilis]|uniref:phage protein NinX family protein n=1 Tax=Proteus mirabilis TaxID=584 RepID=UPI0034E4E357